MGAAEHLGDSGLAILLGNVLQGIHRNNGVELAVFKREPGGGAGDLTHIRIFLVEREVQAGQIEVARIRRQPQIAGTDLENPAGACIP
ncbi:MAG: hypothetical protein M1539_04155 [Actinobacteria bacterium]|nr:hypothetical protein [Actinomycetota bacterium]